MKVRLGFVSNSSSASYYVTILEPPSEALRTIAENCWYPFMDTATLIKELNDLIASLEKRLDDLENKKERFLMIETKPELEERLATFKKYKEDVTRLSVVKWDDLKYTESRAELAKIAFRLNYIDVEENPNALVLSSSTSMHNNYIEGMSQLLQDIVLYYSFEKKNLLLLRVEHDG